MTGVASAQIKIFVFIRIHSRQGQVEGGPSLPQSIPPLRSAAGYYRRLSIRNNAPKRATPHTSLLEPKTTRTLMFLFLEHTAFPWCVGIEVG